ncbi:hypothetical protein TPA0908_02040 [Micromonospora sp. AKA38]|nr:hypothetical protein TPA0908_02040 [Micromonospora sp. AKA38]
MDRRSVGAGRAVPAVASRHPTITRLLPVTAPAAAAETACSSGVFYSGAGRTARDGSPPAVPRIVVSPRAEIKRRR